VIDPNNAYARLGVSPLLSTDEVRALIAQKRGKVVGARRGIAAQGFGAAEAEMTRLQEIEAEIGTPRARLAYDQAHPQNELLTVQSGPDDRRFELRQRADLVSAWLAEGLRLGHDGSLFPSPECRALWSLSGIDDALAGVLSRFVRAAPEEAASTARGGHDGGDPQPPGPAGAELGAEEAPSVAELTVGRHQGR
jgi:hypothetical protein